MRTGLYSLAELFSNRHIEQLVIPEIQRDYVWGEQQVKHLLDSILRNFMAWREERIAPTLKVLRSDSDGAFGDSRDKDRSLQAEFAAFHARRVHSTNVGFIYAYSDNDLPGQCFLIDGQQRLTTLYLALLSVASRHESLKERFQARYCLHSGESDSSDSPAPTRLDYRLREYSSRFLHQWVRHLLETSEPTARAKDQWWYLQRLNNDSTVRNLLNNYETIQGLLDAELKDSEAETLYEYLEDLVECWYFDTNESAQGEELYIYLNARGEGIADNENLKASLLKAIGDAAEKDRWGRKWEEWQDYFWQNRHVPISSNANNPNADRGFNSFLVCIENLEKLRARKKTSTQSADLTVIERYFGVMKWLDENRASFKADYSYSEWIDNWFAEIWGAFNQADAVEWVADLNDQNKGSVHNRMVLVWGSLLCVLLELENASGNFSGLNRTRVYRAIRIIYLRFHNYSRAVTSLEGTVKGLLADSASGFMDLPSTTPEERSKWNYLFDRPEPVRQRLEEVIWKIEDHPLNLKARDLGAVNLTHLVNLEPGVPLQQLEKIRDTFYNLLPPAERASGVSRRKVAAVLLHYGLYWNRVSPFYLESYNLGDWPKTIRGRGDQELAKNGSSVFRKFFDEFLQSQQSLDDFAAEKRGSDQVDSESASDFRTALIWYSEKLGSRFLAKGMYVAIRSFEDEADAHFTALRTIWNTQGDFRGYYGNAKMSDQMRGRA